MIALLFAASFAAAPLPPQGLDTLPAVTSDLRDDGLRHLRVARAAGPIHVDGRLDDPGWEGAARATGFVQPHPHEGAPPPVETEVLIAYDATHLYLGFVARDPEPGQIRATLQQRDQIWNDDYVGVILDPRGDGAVGYYLFANPLGVQGDIQATPQGEDHRIDFVYQTAGRLTPEGFEVEMAIPFGTLRFPDREVQSWRMTLVRHYPRSSRYQISWAPLSEGNPCLLCQLGHLEGIEGIRAGGTLELLPALVASQSGRLSDGADPTSFENAGVNAAPSLGLKYVTRGGWTAEAALNPDFSQVEADAAQVDVNTTFALFYPERRPFFQEGMDLYDTRLNVFYSRSINAPQGAARLTGRHGRTTIGYVAARDEHTPFVLPFEERSAVLQAGPSFTNVLRLRHNVYGDSYVGGLLTDRRLDGGGSGTTASADAFLRFGGVYRLSAHVVGSYTAEPDDATLSGRLPVLTFGGDGDRHTAAFDGETFGGHAASFGLSRSARVWSWNLGYGEASPTYRADTGFQSRNDFRRATAWTGVTLRPDRYGVERVSPGINGGRTWNFAGEGKEAWVSPGIDLTLPRQTHLGVNASFRSETFRGVDFEGLRRYGVWLNSNFSQPVTLGFSAGKGRTVARMFAVPEAGDGIDASVWATLKPARGLAIEPSLTYAELKRADGEEIYAGYIARSRVSFQLNRELQVRTVFQYNDFARRLDVEPLLMYQLNPFSIFYVGSTYGSRDFDGLGFRATDRQYFAKLQYLFRK
jgi:hypothetical protein